MTLVKKSKDTDYLYISTRLRSLENTLLTRDRRERMLEAKTNRDAAKILTECGYSGLDPLTEAALNASLSSHREEVFREVSEYCPNKDLVDVFRLKYDYHNAKVLLTCEKTSADPVPLLILSGMYDPEQIKKHLQGDDNTVLSATMKEALLQARDARFSTGDAQKSDLILDQACYREMTAVAEDSRSEFLQGYVRLQIDALNLKCVVRSLRRKQSLDLIKSALLPGGNVEVEQIITLCLTGGDLGSLFTEFLKEAAVLGDQAKVGGRQTEFEKACDNALNAYLKDCHMIPFGDGVVVAFLSAKENDITAARIILSGRLSGVDPASIRERLRDPYV